MFDGSQRHLEAEQIACVATPPPMILYSTSHSSFTLIAIIFRIKHRILKTINESITNKCERQYTCSIKCELSNITSHSHGKVAQLNRSSTAYTLLCSIFEFKFFFSGCVMEKILKRFFF